MPVSVPTLEEFAALKVKVEALTIPKEVKDALLVVLNWLIGELTEVKT